MPRYSAATNAALVRPVRCLPPLLQLAATLPGGSAAEQHEPWSWLGYYRAGVNRRRCGLLNRLSRRTPATTGHIQPVPTRTMAKGDVQLRGAIQSDVCSAPPPPGWVVANATLQQVCNPSQSLPGTQPAGFFSQLNVRNHKWHYIC